MPTQYIFELNVRGERFGFEVMIAADTFESAKEKLYQDSGYDKETLSSIQIVRMREVVTGGAGEQLAQKT